MNSRSIALGLFVLDLLATFIVFNVVSLLRGAPAPWILVLWPLAVPALALTLSIYLIDGYNARTDMLSVDYASLHAITIAGATIATMLTTYVVLPAGYDLQSSRVVIAFSFIGLVPVTLAYRRFVHLRMLARRGERSLVFLGDAASCGEFERECRRMRSSQRILFAVVSVESIPPFAPNGPSLRPFGEILNEIESGKLAVEAIVLRESARELSADVAQRLVQLYFRGVPTYTLELFHEVYWRKIPLYRLNQTWLFQEGFEIAREPVFERIKRVSDVVLSTLGLLLGAPLIALGALAIWVEDRGPVFFAQTRVGKNHAPFRLTKLRTMRPAAIEPVDPYTRPGDTRITRVGRLLRTTRLDELPQLWNVLRGEMSLIGPRAEWDRLVDTYEREVPCYYFRHLVRPGITGWAQVNYPYGANLDDTLRKLEYDLYYIRHFSFLLDATILLKTIHIMLFGKGR
ncbi:MAG: exopolysaccharide biosynthesis polyprenyl glycosylphosphotransferase [Opitutaceae bacterium]|nr:exopolysaccharide biosynthesis polyprenyl glycosylphosphotransferase [Opitutaceae bacterium]